MTSDRIALSSESSGFLLTARTLEEYFFFTKSKIRSSSLVQTTEISLNPLRCCFRNKPAAKLHSNKGNPKKFLKFLFFNLLEFLRAGMTITKFSLRAFINITGNIFVVLN